MEAIASKARTESSAELAFRVALRVRVSSLALSASEVRTPPRSDSVA
jgi:hypothetical protein